MTVPLTIGLTTYLYPSPGDNNWGQQATGWAIAVTNNLGPPKSGGLYQLLGELDWGNVAGMRALYLRSETLNPATIGFLRSARTDVLAWRNQANDNNLTLGVNSSNELVFNGTVLTGDQDAFAHVVTDSGTVNSDQPDDTFSIVGGTGISTSASGKVITVTFDGETDPTQVVVSFSFGDASPKNIYLMSANKLVIDTAIFITTAFNGTGAALTLGDAGNVSRFIAAAQVIPGTIGQYETAPGHVYVFQTQITLTITPGGGASTGAGYVVINTQS